ncbi:MAG: hypothetical protein NTY38_33115, partial [Acidobacteria bacterium]|nr:hypothetical protein [Acidobacteriota bacterium]
GNQFYRRRMGPGWIWARYPTRQLDIHSHIEDYMLIWVTGLADYNEQTGDDAFIRPFWPKVARLLDWFHRNRAASGLVRARDFAFVGSPVVYLTGEGTTLNAHYLLALRAAAILARTLGNKTGEALYAGRGAELARAMRASLRVEGSDLYLAMVDGGRQYPPSVHANVMALLAGLVPPERESSVLDWIESNLSRESISPFMYYWVFEMLYRLRDGARAERLVLDRIRRKWGPLAPLGTVREGFSPASPSHIAGTVPAWVAASGILGVRVEQDNGSRQLRIRPRMGDLEWAQGAVPTTLGLVEVHHRWTKQRWASEIRVPPLPDSPGSGSNPGETPSKEQSPRIAEFDFRIPVHGRCRRR